VAWARRKRENRGVARPLRKLYDIPRHARRRHRTWVLSMTLATLAMAVWGLTLVWMRVSPQSAPRFEIAFLAAGFFAVPGVILALLTVRAKLAWLLFACVPLFANASMLVLPWIARWLRDHRA
jgi:hypothetical protein